MEILPKEIKTKIMPYTLSCPFKDELLNCNFNEWSIYHISDDISYPNVYYKILHK